MILRRSRIRAAGVRIVYGLTAIGRRKAARAVPKLPMWQPGAPAAFADVCHARPTQVGVSSSDEWPWIGCFRGDSLVVGSLSIDARALSKCLCAAILGATLWILRPPARPSLAGRETTRGRYRNAYAQPSLARRCGFSDPRPGLPWPVVKRRAGSARKRVVSPSADCLDDFYVVAGDECVLVVAALRNDFAVDLDRDAPFGATLPLQQCAHGQSGLPGAC